MHFSQEGGCSETYFLCFVCLPVPFFIQIIKTELPVNIILLPSAISYLFSLWQSCTVLFCQFGALDKTHTKENITGLKYTPRGTSCKYLNKS